jgi:hypothetical protein
MVPPMAVVPIHGGLGRRIGGRLNSEETADAAEDATNSAADDATNRSCCLASHNYAMSDAVGDALCLRRKWAS